MSRNSRLRYDYDAADNSRGSWALAVPACREMRIRKGVIPPETETEWRWYGEGPREPRDLETLKRGRDE